MKKNIVIVILSFALLWCLGIIVNDMSRAARMRAAHQVMRVALSDVWKVACEHAASGSRDRVRWCEFAARETSSGAEASDEDMEALALQYIQTKTGKK